MPFLFALMHKNVFLQCTKLDIIHSLGSLNNVFCVSKHVF